MTASTAEDMDDCPVCERETVYDGDRCAECGRLWGIDYSRADIEDRHRREKAERIAVAHAAQFEHETDPRGGDLYAPILAALTAAALQALTESENAR